MKTGFSVNEVGADIRTVADIRKKVVGHQGERKKKRSLPTGEARVRGSGGGVGELALSELRGDGLLLARSHQHPASILYSLLFGCMLTIGGSPKVSIILRLHNSKSTDWFIDGLILSNNGLCLLHATSNNDIAVKNFTTNAWREIH